MFKSIGCEKELNIDIEKTIETQELKNENNILDFIINVIKKIFNA